MKAIKQAQTRNILDAYDRGDISYSRMNELLNELADKFAIGFAEWLGKNHYKLYNENKENCYWVSSINGYTPIKSKELLEIYKKEKGL
jgi:hypothetical protein